MQSLISSRLRKPAIHAVDLFCGAGGLTCGLQQAGIKVKAGVDVDKACEYAFSHNNKALFIPKSVADIHGTEFADFTKGADYTLFAGCAPCQAFSSMNRKGGKTDPRWHLLNEFSRLIQETLPDFVAMENVPQLLNQEIFKDFIETLKKCGYQQSDWKVVHCEDYGLPQHRHRLVLLASRIAPIKIISPKEFGAVKKSVRDAIGGLPPLKAGEVSQKDPLHRCRGLSPLNMKRIQASKPGGTWHDWPEELRAGCHKRERDQTYQSVYARMTWEDPSPTMTTQFVAYGSGRFGHPEQDRGLSLREGAILQSFPAGYAFTRPDEPIYLSTVAKLIGNAVPVVIGELIGKSIFRHLNPPSQKNLALQGF